LSLTHLDGEEVKQRFPNIYHHCLEEGYDLTKEPIPITPVQHYHMGGIKVDLDSKTSVEGLLAVGEASCNGVHGANRLASNSLLESLVFAECAANYVTEHLLEKEDLHTEASGEDKNLQSVSSQCQEKDKNVQVDLRDCQNKEKYPQLDLSSYQEEELKKEYKKIILNEIKRRDGEFYAKWCNNEN
ncbi:MAG: FAD-binding protein, partial [Lachnospiraceae bacterium]|nr:FAD-binding protein [Lachnospiraceae bacterium]